MNAIISTDNEKESNIQKILTAIGLALHSCHNTVTTDIPEIEPSETSWRINNSKEIELLSRLEELLITNTDTCPLCGCCNKNP